MEKLRVCILLGVLAGALAQGEPNLRIRSAGRLRDSATGPQITEETVVNGVPAEDAGWSPATTRTAAPTVDDTPEMLRSTLATVQPTGEDGMNVVE